MPLGVRDFLLIIRAKDQASRVVADVGRNFAGLQKQSSAAMRSAQADLRRNNAQVMQAFRQDTVGFNQVLRQNAAASAALSTQNARLRIDMSQAATAAERALIGAQIQDNNLRKAMFAEQNVALRQNIGHRREAAQEQLRIAKRTYDEEKAAFQKHNDDIQARIARTTQVRQQGQSLLGIGAGVAVAGAAGLAFFGSATKAAIDYNKEASKTLTQVPKELGASLEQVKDIGRNVARDVPAPFEQMQAALYDIFSSMSVTIPQAENLLRGFAKAAVAGVTDVETASQAGISLLNAFKLPPTAANIQRVLDVQFETVRVGRIEYDELAKTIGRAIPSAVKAGQSMEDLGALISFLTRNGLSAAMAATSAARAFDLMTNPKFGDKLKGLGVEVADAEGKFRPFLDIMTDLRKRMEGTLSPEMAKNMQSFFADLVDPKELKFLEDMGIQVKETVGGKNFAGQIKKNSAAMAAISTKNAALRAKAASMGASADKKAISQAIANNNVQRAILSEQNVNLRAAGSSAKESMRPIAAIMADINEKLKEVSPQERAALMQELTKGAGGTIQAMRAVNLTITDSNDLFGTLTEDIRDNQGAIAAAYGIMRDTPAAKIEELKNKWAVLRTEIGDNLIPAALKLLDAGLGILNWFEDLDPSTRRTIVLVGAAASGFLLLAGGIVAVSGAILILKSTAMAFGATVPHLLFLFTAWLTILAALALGVYILITRWDDFKRGIRVILAAIVDFFLGMAESVLEVAARAFGWIPGLGGKLKGALEDFKQWRVDVNNEILGIKQPVIEPVIKTVAVQPAVYEALSKFHGVMGGTFGNAIVDKSTLVDTSIAGKATSTAGGRVQYRALGGPVSKFKTYVVGERGPELLKMGAQAGSVLSTSDWIREQSRNRLNLPKGMRFRSDVRLDPSQVEDRRHWRAPEPPLSPWRGQAGGRQINVNVKTDADANEIAHEIAFVDKYGL